MKITTGQKAPDFSLTDINGTKFKLENIKGKRCLLTFYRFASCPFCNIRLHNLISNYDKFGDDFKIIAVFDSSLENLKNYATRHKSPFPVLADENNEIHRLYHIEHSLSGVIKGIVFRFPTLIASMLKGYIPWRIRGDITAMPADFLIDEEGIVQVAYYGRDEGAHLSVDLIKHFSHQRAEIVSDLIEV